MSFRFTAITMCDRQGNLDFYTNGNWIANRNHDTLMGSQNFNPGWASGNYSPWGLPYMQTVVALPNPNDSSQYFVINHCADQYLPANIRIPLKVSYSLLDMNLDSGLGGTVVKDSTIISDTLNNGHMAAC